MVKKLRLNGAIALPAVFVALLAIAIPVIYFAPKQQVASLQNVADPNFANNEKRIAAETAARTALIQAFGGLFVAATAFIAWRQFLLTQEKQAAERFSKAVEQLGDKNIHVRLGGIYALEQIAKDAEDKYYWQVMEQLTFFVREESPAPSETSDQQDVPLLRRDIQEVMTVLSRRNHSYGNGEDHRLDLSNTDLRRLQLPKANLFGAILTKANLQQAWLNEATLEDAKLGNAILADADLFNADLKCARLVNANLQNARLGMAQLQYAELDGANLQYARLHQADLQNALLRLTNLRADLYEAKLQGADLRRADLQNSRLLGADLEGANLDLANIHGVSLERVNLRNADLRQVLGLTSWEQLREVKSYTEELLPDYLLRNKPLSPVAPNPPDRPSEKSRSPESEAEPPQP